LRRPVEIATQSGQSENCAFQSDVRRFLCINAVINLKDVSIAAKMYGYSTMIKRNIAAVLTLMVLSACEPQPTNTDDVDLENLDGKMSECSGRAASAAGAAIMSLYNDTGWTEIMSPEGAAKIAVAVVVKTTAAMDLELESCIADIYRMGIEDGRVLEREVY
jgi:hypothetical protein